MNLKKIQENVSIGWLWISISLLMAQFFGWTPYNIFTFRKVAKITPYIQLFPGEKIRLGVEPESDVKRETITSVNWKIYKEGKILNFEGLNGFSPTIRLPPEGGVPPDTKLRAVKYLNNSMENDHKSTKSKSRYRQWYQSFSTAKNTLDGMEAMRMIQKGQVSHVAKDVLKQNIFVRNLFGLAA